MSTATEPKPWDFTAVFDLLHALSPAKDPAYDTPHESSIFISPFENDGASKPAALGDFSRLWTHLGKPLDLLTTKSDSDASGLSSSPSDQSIFSFSPIDDTEPSDDTWKQTKEVRWKDDVEASPVAGSRKKHANISIIETVDAVPQFDSSEQKPLTGSKPVVQQTPLRPSAATYRSAVPDGTELGSEAEIGPTYQTPQHQVFHSRQLVDSIYTQTTPSSITSRYLSSILSSPYLFQAPAFQIPLSSDTNLLPTVIAPFERLTPAEKRARLFEKLVRAYGPIEDTSLAAFPSPGSFNTSADTRTSSDGIHIFVDCSNIVIGFYDCIKKARGLHPQAYIRNAPLSWSSLALVLERGRAVARRVIVGSTSKDMKLPQYLSEAEKLGYELNILERVLKHKNATPKKAKSNGNGYATSGHSSGSEAPLNLPKVMSEQGVDEILHMKLLESIVDTEEPSTIVLASGDAAEAEYSGGFLKNVQRALVKGWKVEIVAWHDGLSHAYKLLDLSKQWDGQFTIVDLDEFCEDILAL